MRERERKRERARESERRIDGEPVVLNAFAHVAGLKLVFSSMPQNRKLVPIREYEGELSALTLRKFRKPLPVKQLKKLHGSDWCQALRSRLTISPWQQDLVLGALIQLHVEIGKIRPLFRQIRLANGFAPFSLCVTFFGPVPVTCRTSRSEYRLVPDSGTRKKWHRKKKMPLTGACRTVRSEYRLPKTASSS
jgi:hypothetical protein